MLNLWLQIRSSLWFVPGVMVIAALAAAIGLVEVDVLYGTQLALARWRIFLDAGPEGARAMLMAIASSMVTIAGVAFSVTIVTLSLASTQYTPRILRNFMRDRVNRYVLGGFVGIFTYCLMVLRTIRGSNGSPEVFVPLLAVFFAMLLALVGSGLFILFIHHTATSIQASYILELITEETIAAVNRLFPDRLEDPPASRASSANLAGKEWQVIGSAETGYLQCVGAESLLKFAREHDVVLRLERMVGDFVLTEAPLVSAAPPLDDDSATKLHACFVIGNFRTVEQDVGFGIRQIVDIAMKALSPGVNDTSTAVSCLDYLSAILAHMATRRLDPYFPMDGVQFRIMGKAPTFEDHVAKAFDEIRLSAAGNVSICLQMLCAIERVAKAAQGGNRQAVLLQHGKLVRNMAAETVPAPYDRARIGAELDSLRDKLGVSNLELLPLL